MELVAGRPKDKSRRLEKEVRVYDLLDELQIPFERIDHEEANTMEACAEIDLVLNAAICKNLFLCDSKQEHFYLLMICGDKKFRTSEISKQVGSTRLSFASAEKMQEYLDITPGSVSVLGLMNDKEHQVQLLVDEELKESDYFGCHPCINTSSLRLQTRDLFEKILPRIEHEPIFVKA